MGCKLPLASEHGCIALGVQAERPTHPVLTHPLLGIQQQAVVVVVCLITVEKTMVEMAVAVEAADLPVSTVRKPFQMEVRELAGKAMMVVEVKSPTSIHVQEEAEVFPVLELMVNVQSPHQKGEMVATVIACNGIQMSTTTTEPEEEVARVQTLSLRDLVVNTEEVMVDKEAPATQIMRDTLAKHLQALEEEEVEMEVEAPTTVLQVVRV